MNSILDANRALGWFLWEAELISIQLKGVGWEVRALGRNFNMQGRTFPKLRKVFAKTGAATREARGVTLQANPKKISSRSAEKEERAPRPDWTATSATHLVYPVRTEVGRRHGTLARGTPVPPRVGTVFPFSDLPPRFPRGGVPARRGAGGVGVSKSTPAPRRRGACLFCGHSGHWV